MNAELEQLAVALRERIELIGDPASRSDPETHMQRLQEISEQIESLERKAWPFADPQLRHYLQRRSYSKALEHLMAPGTTDRVS